jgi:hypothetical protein
MQKPRCDRVRARGGGGGGVESTCATVLRNFALLRYPTVLSNGRLSPYCAPLLHDRFHYIRIQSRLTDRSFVRLRYVTAPIAHESLSAFRDTATAVRHCCCRCRCCCCCCCCWGLPATEASSAQLIAYTSQTDLHASRTRQRQQPVIGDRLPLHGDAAAALTRIDGGQQRSAAGRRSSAAGAHTPSCHTRSRPAHFRLQYLFCSITPTRGCSTDRPTDRTDGRTAGTFDRYEYIRRPTRAPPNDHGAQTDGQANEQNRGATREQCGEFAASSRGQYSIECMQPLSFIGAAAAAAATTTTGANPTEPGPLYSLLRILECRCRNSGLLHTDAHVTRREPAGRRCVRPSFRRRASVLRVRPTALPPPSDNTNVVRREKTGGP